jgi:hypothetical protein
MQGALLASGTSAKTKKRHAMMEMYFSKNLNIMNASFYSSALCVASG